MWIGDEWYNMGSHIGYHFSNVNNPWTLEVEIRPKTFRLELTILSKSITLSPKLPIFEGPFPAVAPLWQTVNAKNEEENDAKSLDFCK